MKELLECKDLRDSERVIEAYWGLKDYPTVTREIPPHLSLADIAFEMRDALCPEDERWEWERILGNTAAPKLLSLGESNSYALRHGTAEHWIIAAVLAWEAAK